MRERPILFSGPMVNAILAGKKTQTRRVVKPQPHRRDMQGWPLHPTRTYSPGGRRGTLDYHAPLTCPYGQPGDRLWVRETWGMSYEDIAHGRPHTRGGTWGSPARPGRVQCAVYRADDPAMPDDSPTETARWCPSIHMPRWASRLTLDVVSVRVERLQDISEADAQAEGVEPMLNPYEDAKWWRCYGKDFAERDFDPEDALAELTVCTSARRSFETLWHAINGRASWDANPWVWVVEFAPLDAAVRAQLGGGR